MRLDQLHDTEGKPLTRGLERALESLVEGDHDVTELYQGLWDFHDGASRLVPAIQEFARLNPLTERERAIQLLFQIQSELYQHLEGHLHTMKPVLAACTDRLVGGQ